MFWHKGRNNLITDVSGIGCGHAQDDQLASGVSVILPDEAAVAGCDIRGGAPGTLGTDVLPAENLVEKVDGLFLSGGSVYGLASGAGMTDWLGKQGKGFSFLGSEDVLPAPVVAGAILFDLNNGGNKAWGDRAPYYNLAQEACIKANRGAFKLGNIGAGLGAVAGSVKGGLGSASSITDDGFEIGALVAVNSFGSVVCAERQRLWAADFALAGEMGGEMGEDEIKGSGLDLFAESKMSPRKKTNTVIGICATNAILTSSEAKRIAMMAQDGIARAVRPSHTIFDGDVVFVVATGKKPLEKEMRELKLTELGGLAADCLTRAIGRGVYQADSLYQSLSYREAYGL